MDDFTRIKRIVKDIYYNGDYNYNVYAFKKDESVKLDINGVIKTVDNYTEEQIKSIMDGF
jgi:hypothetical protein